MVPLRQRLRQAEIAEREGISVGPVKKRQHDAIKKLRTINFSVTSCPSRKSGILKSQWLLRIELSWGSNRRDLPNRRKSRPRLQFKMGTAIPSCGANIGIAKVCRNLCASSHALIMEVPKRGCRSICRHSPMGTVKDASDNCSQDFHRNRESPPGSAEPARKMERPIRHWQGTSGESGSPAEPQTRTPDCPCETARRYRTSWLRTLFGRERGACTTGIGNRKGLVRQAEGGTLFLDEVMNCYRKLAAQSIPVTRRC
jgi:hypothetical protein